MARQNYNVTDLIIETLGSIMMNGQGDQVLINASGTEGAASLRGAKSCGMFTGPAMVAMQSTGDAEGQVAIQAGEAGTVKIGVGPLEASTMISLAPEELTISVGPPGAGASITLTPESITLKVAEVVFTLTAEGITEDVAECTRELTPEGHNLTAGETEFNLGVQGETAEGPTKEEEIEGGNVENETLGSDTTDAAKNEDAGIIITE
ncbi:MAG: hypothetical protein AB7K24_33555 [Gemmataceae bacterium]